MNDRVVPGLIMIAVWLLVAFGPVFLLALLLLAATGVALREYFQMTLPDLRGGPRLCAMLCGLAPLLAALSGRADMVVAGLVAALGGVVGMGLARFGEDENVVHFLGVAGFAALYIGLGSACLMLLGSAEHKSLWLMLLIAITAGSDTGAYYAGRRYGHRKIFPRISPRKTLAGVLGGLACGVLAAVLVHALLRGPFGLPGLILISVLLVAAGIAGDLAESMLKRTCGVKDSGTILAGHGGVLDRIDSMLLVAPALYALLLIWRLV